jgi:hypothetical protein
MYQNHSGVDRLVVWLCGSVQGNPALQSPKQMRAGARPRGHCPSQNQRQVLEEPREGPPQNCSNTALAKINAQAGLKERRTSRRPATKLQQRWNCKFFSRPVWHLGSCPHQAASTFHATRRDASSAPRAPERTRGPCCRAG